ncbi:MAG TPA: prepilin-type N-terminal cleavage/methylation domain-containing protein [Gemmatimonadota bacterium]|nr:prepilin-type N-terminal cleavage/methylation domain-containing protein [Gemmatimonadota bacterium]
MKNTANRLSGSEGFTLIELLIVVVIIGILAAIAIPQFASTKEKAFDAAAKSDVRNLQTAEEAYFADNQAYTDVTIAGAPSGGTQALGGATFHASPNVAITASAATNGYTITASHTSSSNGYCISTTPSGTGEIVQGTTC